MAFRFIHTADWQIGKVFRFVDDGTMGVLQQARLEAISRIGELAAEHGVGQVLVAGDVWDHADPALRTRIQTLERMREHAAVQWHLLPGNHDAHRPSGLWDQMRRRGLPENVHMHTEPEISEIQSGVAALLPAPLQHRRTLGDLTAWMDDAQTDAKLIRIGLAHGSVHGFGTNEEQHVNQIDPARPELAGLDYLALGDWHGPQIVNDRCSYSGTPETDSFTTHGTGTALLVEIDAPGAEPRVTQLDTGQYTWILLPASVRSRSDIDLLNRHLRSLDSDPSRTLVSLTVDGGLTLAELDYFERTIKEDIGASLTYLSVNDEALIPMPSDEDLDAIDVGGFVRVAANRLRETAEAGGEGSKLAREALRRLFIEQQRLESISQ